MILTVYSADHAQHNPPFEIYDGVKEPYAESPARLENIVSALQKAELVEVMKPKSFPQGMITRLHMPEYVNFVAERAQALDSNAVLYPSYFLQDTYTPITSGTFDAAVSAVNVALTAAERIVEGERVVYALCRPPGHHAEHKAMGGYCYFNNAGIAAEWMIQEGNAQRVAMLDIDFHHGNGTQELFYDRSDVLYVSIHADPRDRFPYSSGFERENGRGDGHGFTINYPLALGTGDAEYLNVLDTALKQIKEYSPDYLIISLGFDTYEKDPIGGFGLTQECYQDIAWRIMALGLPVLVVQEGGYHVEDLGELAVSFVKGLS